MRTSAAGNSEYSEYLLGWMAYAAQHPGRQGEVAVVLRGKEGVGKGVFAKEFGRLFGSHFKHIVNAKHLVGHFNAHLQHCSVLFADEAFFAGDRSHESVLKGLITEETILMEPKGVDSYSVRNCIHLIMSSNSDWVVPAGADARRYFVLDVRRAHMQDHKYFAAIARQMDNGGRAALLHYLLNLDISGFDVRAVPQTAALADQKTRSRRGVDRLGRDRGPRRHTAGGGHHLSQRRHHHRGGQGRGLLLRRAVMVPELRHDSSIVVAKTLKEEWGCKTWKSGYRRGIEFPPLLELRAMFDRRHGPQDWPADVVDWEGARDLERVHQNARPTRPSRPRAEGAQAAPAKSLLNKIWAGWARRARFSQVGRIRPTLAQPAPIGRVT